MPLSKHDLALLGKLDEFISKRRAALGSTLEGLSPDLEKFVGSDWAEYKQGVISGKAVALADIDEIVSDLRQANKKGTVSELTGSDSVGRHLSVMLDVVAAQRWATGFKDRTNDSPLTEAGEVAGFHEVAREASLLVLSRNVPWTKRKATDR